MGSDNNSNGVKGSGSSAVPPPPSTKSSSNDMKIDSRKLLIVIIAIWMVHTWSVALSPAATSSTTNPSTALSNSKSAFTTSSSSSSNNANNYNQAKEQSFNFFNDISNTQWRMLQSYHAKLFPNYYADLTKYSSGPGDKGKISVLRNSNMWYGQNFQVEFVCPLMRRLPSDSMADGPKWVCNPHRLAQKKDCLIYSVGSNGKAEFEKAVIEEIGKNCEIHTFDPVSYNKRNGDFATALHPYSTFHNWGLATPEQSASQPTKYKTLAQTMAELGHTNRTIDVFKIDCEWCEWFTWQEWLTVDMRQILVETHNSPMPNARDFFFNLHDKGFVIFSKEANYENGAGGVEYAFVKLSTDFFVNDTMYYKQSK